VNQVAPVSLVDRVEPPGANRADPVSSAEPPSPLQAAPASSVDRADRRLERLAEEAWAEQASADWALVIRRFPLFHPLLICLRYW